MATIDQEKNRKIRELARTLRASGLATSDSQAVSMATSMTNTESKINDKATKTTHEERERVVKNPEPVTPSNTNQNPTQRSTSYETDNRTSSKTDYNYYETVKNKISSNQNYSKNKSLEEQKKAVYQQKTPSKHYEGDEPRTKETIDQGILNHSEDIDISKMSVEEAAGINPHIAKQEENQQTADDAKPQEQQKDKPKKDTSHMKEAKVDLGSIFDSSKK